MGRVPTEQDAMAVVWRVWGVATRSVQRLPTGLANWVYAVETVDGRRAVARLNRPGHGAHFAAAVAWQERLIPLGVPLPSLLACVADPADGACPFMLLEHLPGADLGQVYPQLSRAQKRALAMRLAAIQQAVGRLPAGPGFGYARSYDDPDLQASWAAVLRAALERSRQRLERIGLASRVPLDQIAARLDRHAGYCEAVAPCPFLDDTTTKNVLVDHGHLSGIVDVDCLCFGDPLLTVALTRASLLNRGYDTDYIDDWCAELPMDSERWAVLDLYTALFCVDFLSELALTGNRGVAPTVDAGPVQHLLDLLEHLLARC